MDYARTVADRLLTGAQQGRVVLSRDVPGEAENEWTPAPVTTKTEALRAVVKGVSAEFVDGTTVLASDLEVLCVPPTMEAEPTDGISIDGKAATILRVTPIPAAGQPAVLRLIVRG